MSLTLSNVSFSYYGGSCVLNDINLKIDDTQFVGIAGKTGSGKSTLAKIMAGVIKPSSGSVTLESDIGLVLQCPEDQLFANTVIEDVMFAPKSRGYDRKTSFDIAREAMRIVGLGSEYEGRSPYSLSGGEKRLAAIAGVIAMKPKTIILDEPAAGLDFKMHNRVFGVLKDINESGVTVVVVSHYMNDIASYCSRAVLLSEGKIAYDGDPSYLTDSNEFYEYASDISLLASDLRKNGFDIHYGITNVAELVEELSKGVLKVPQKNF